MDSKLLYETLEALALGYIGANLLAMPYYYRIIGKIVKEKGPEGAKKFLDSRPTPIASFFPYMFARKLHDV